MDIIDRFRNQDSQNDITHDVPTDADVRKSIDIVREIEKIRYALSRNSLYRAETAADWLDKKWLDPLVGAFLAMFGIHVVNGVPTAIAGLYIVGEAKLAGVPNKKIVQMLRNIGIDLALTAVPVFGHIADFFYQSNVKNVKIMREYLEELERNHPEIV